jgi:superfamily II DNA helicase RecQ
MQSSQNDDVLVSLLRRHFGYASFRPHQREVIEAFAAGREGTLCE